MELSGSAIITGAGGGIGGAIAKRFADFGCSQLLLVDLSREKLLEVERSILGARPSVKIVLRDCDLTHEGVCESLVQDAISSFGRLSYVVNCAGRVGEFATCTDSSIELFDAVQSLNVRATYRLQRAAIIQMQKQEPVRGESGSIVNIGSTTSHVGQARLPSYVTSKHAIAGMTKAAGVDHAKDRIRVNCVCPGLVWTDLGTHMPQEIVKAELNPYKEKTPMRRAARPEEIANCVVFLSSPLASYVTATSLMADGGFTAV